MLKNNLITKTDIEMVHKKHSNLVFEMIDTCVKYLNYYYGAQIKKGDPDANLKKCTMETLEKYVNLCEFISVEYINIDVIELCTQYYLFEILQAFQNKGVGRKLLEFLLQKARSEKMNTFFLEVRASNLFAIHLYESLGFEQISVRRDYYPSLVGREDGLVYSFASLSDLA